MAALLVIDAVIATTLLTGVTGGPTPAPTRARTTALAQGTALRPGAGSPGPVTAPPMPAGSNLDAIHEAVVLSDDRTVVVDTSWGSNLERPWLVIAGQESQVSLALVEPPALPGPNDLVGYGGTAQATLVSPLGGRPLIDQSTGQPIPTVHQAAMAEVTALPPGYRLDGIEPGTMIGLVNDQPLTGAVRTYTAPKGDGAPLEVTQFPSISTSEGATYLGAQVTIEVRGSPGIYQTDVDPTTGASVASSLSWSEDGWVFVLSSLPDWGYQHPLSETGLVSVAAGVVPTEPAPSSAQVGW